MQYAITDTLFYYYFLIYATLQAKAKNNYKSQEFFKDICNHETSYFVFRRVRLSFSQKIEQV